MISLNNPFESDFWGEYIKNEFDKLPEDMSKSEKMLSVNEISIIVNGETRNPFSDKDILDIKIDERIDISEREYDIYLILSRRNKFNIIWGQLKTKPLYNVNHFDIIGLKAYISLLNKYNTKDLFLGCSVEKYNETLIDQGFTKEEYLI